MLRCPLHSLRDSHSSTQQHGTRFREAWRVAQGHTAREWHVVSPPPHPRVSQIPSPAVADRLTPLPLLAGTEAHGLQRLSGSLCEAASAAWSQQGTQRPWVLHRPLSSEPEAPPHPTMSKALTVWGVAAPSGHNFGAQQLLKAKREQSC